MRCHCHYRTNDMVAIGAMDALSEKGFRIPEDYSIIGLTICSTQVWSVYP